MGLISAYAEAKWDSLVVDRRRSCRSVSADQSPKRLHEVHARVGYLSRPKQRATIPVWVSGCGASSTCPQLRK